MKVTFKLGISQYNLSNNISYEKKYLYNARIIIRIIVYTKTE